MSTKPAAFRRFARSSAEAFAIDRACAVERWKPSVGQRAKWWVRQAFRGESGLGIALAIVLGIVGAALLARAAVGGAW